MQCLLNTKVSINDCIVIAVIIKTTTAINETYVALGNDGVVYYKWSIIIFH